MKTKLLFSAALLAATVGAQAVPNTGSSMLVQLLESQGQEMPVCQVRHGALWLVTLQLLLRLIQIVIWQM